jgi:uncharacterized RDD family membrane protein YckC
MNNENPYSPPVSDLMFVDEIRKDGQLAGRFTRLAASLVDSIVGLVFGFPLMYFMGIWSYVGRGQQAPFLLIAAATVLGFLWFLLVHGYLLKKNGQTIGKLLTGIRISDLEGRVPSFSTLIFFRYLPMSILSLIPLVGPYLSFVDVCFIFRADRRCVHDFVAGTKVVLAK